MDRWMDGWVMDGWVMDGWMDGCALITVQGGCDGVGQSEVSADSGTDSCAVQGASTFMRPEWTTGLRTHSHTAAVKNS